MKWIKILWKLHILEAATGGVLLKKNVACNFIKKEFLAQVFSFEFCEILKNTYFTEHLRKIASEIDMKIVERYHLSMFREEQIRSKRLRLFRVEKTEKICTFRSFHLHQNKYDHTNVNHEAIKTRVNIIFPFLSRSFKARFSRRNWHI